MIQDFLSLLFPDLCYTCLSPLRKAERGICTYCRYHLPKTNFHLHPDNPVSRMFWGRVEIQAATAYYYFQKGGKVQQAIHRLKYRGHREAGRMIGNMFGAELKDAPGFSSANYLIPVPLHPARERKRGYNQSLCIAEGISSGMGIPLMRDLLLRTRHNPTQTRKSHYERWMNVESVFSLGEISGAEGKHYILVDDVITTGATLEACATALLKIPGTRVSIASLAYAVQG